MTPPTPEQIEADEKLCEKAIAELNNPANSDFYKAFCSKINPSAMLVYLQSLKSAQRRVAELEAERDKWHEPAITSTFKGGCPTCNLMSAEQGTPIQCSNCEIVGRATPKGEKKEQA